MKTTFYKAILSLDNTDTYIVNGLINTETGRVYTLPEFACTEAQTAYIDDLDILYIYIVHYLLKQGYTNVLGNKLQPKEFIIKNRNGCGAVSWHNGGGRIDLIKFRAKFGQDMSDDMAVNRQLVAYAAAHHRTRNSIGADAYNEFLHTIYKAKKDDTANYSLIREMFPILKENYSLAKRACTGYQYVACGRYQDIYEYDIVSSYPAAALHDHPYKAPERYDGYVKSEYNTFSIYEFVYTGKQLKSGGIDWLENPTGIGPNGYGMLSQSLFAELSNDYTFDYFNVTHTHVFKTRKSVLRKFITKNIIKGKEQEQSPAIRKYNKRIGNSLTGYFGRNPQQISNVFTLNGDKLASTPKSYQLDKLYEPLYISVLDKAKSGYLRVCRDLHRQGILIYANTDSVFTRIPVAFPQDLSAIGYWKQRTHFKTLIIDAINEYVGEDYDGNLTNALSGIKLAHSITPDEYAAQAYEMICHIPNTNGTMQRVIVTKLTQLDLASMLDEYGDA